MKKRFLAGMVAAALLSGTAFATAKVIWTEETLATTETVVTYTDTQTLSKQDNDVLQVLYALGVMQGDEDAAFRPEDGVTRAEMAKILVTMQQLPIAEFPESGFDDVANTHWAKNAIAIVKSQGLMSGDGDGTFAPERSLSKEELCKVITVLLGYGPMAKINGGYPDGYLEVIKRFVLKTDMVLPGQVTRLEVAKMLYQALQTPLMEQTTFGSPENATYKICDGLDGEPLATLLQRNFLIERN